MKQTFVSGQFQSKKPMITVLDVENTTTPREKGKPDMTPYNPNNRLVSVGWCNIKDGQIINESYEFIYHSELPNDHDVNAAFLHIQRVLDGTSLLVAQNAKHDLAWLLESGFRYEGPVYDTMIAEYLLSRGRKWPLDLESVAKRRRVTLKLSELVREQLKAGVTMDKIPLPVVEEYGRGDIRTTAELYLVQQEIFEDANNKVLLPTRDMMNEFCVTLTDMERNGIKIDQEALRAVEKEYQTEKSELERKLAQLTYEVMGDTPINLASPEQLSMVIYSRKVNDKEVWAKAFSIGTDHRGRKLRRPKLSREEFNSRVRKLTTILKKTKAHQCHECQGKGRVHKVKKDGNLFAKAHKCKVCGGSGLLYQEREQISGFKLIPRGVLDVAQGGFASDKNTIEFLIAQARTKHNDKAVEFLEAVRRLNAVDTYLSSFVGGINRGLQPDGILHPRFNQTVTATGRLSSSDPNFQNQPRGSTFPVRRAVVSRFEGGSILEADYAQLEFRCAGILAACPDIAAAIAAGVDVHSDTAGILTTNGQPTDRQGAKSHTFKPLYGGTSGTPAEQAYYRTFLTERYPRVGEWHVELQEEAIRYKRVRLPTGREYYFAAERMPWGGASFATQIKNYPVQGFATADIVPIANIRLRRLFLENHVSSLHINTVHDSIVVDVFPGEELLVRDLVLKAMLGAIDDLKSRYGVVLSIPLEVEVKIGPNWLDMKKMCVADTNGKYETYGEAA